MSLTFVHHVRSMLDRDAGLHRYISIRETATGVTEETTSFGEIDEQARQVAAGLADRLPAGERVLLAYPGGVDFLVAFLGSLYAGVIPVPAPLPRDRRSMERHSGIMHDAGVRLVLTDKRSVEHIADLLRQIGGFDRVGCLATDAAPIGDAARWVEPDRIGADTVAFLQYTSGSTSRPRGVVVTHGNLLTNQRELAVACGMDSRMVLVSWLPHFHDMGLIGGLLSPLFVGGNCVLMTPTHFIKRPLHWLQAMSRHHATNTFAPNFAYDLCLQRVTDDQVRELDLSALRSCINGSEPVKARTITEFTRRMKPAGLRPEAVKPGYGLAEATLMVSVTPLDQVASTLEVDRDALGRDGIVPASDGAGTVLVGSGVPVDQRIRVVEPDTGRTLREHAVGEIWTRGASIAAGYWNNPDATRETFEAWTTDGEGPFLRTGDLGFLASGRLFVTGRRKDMLIVKGRNIYPQDIESVVQAVHPAVRGRIGAAFSAGPDSEHVVIVQEASAPMLRGLPVAGLAAQIREEIVRTFDVSLPGVVLIASGVPRTTSGKVQRRSCRDMFLAQDFEVLHQELTPQILGVLLETVAAGDRAR